jgi:uncharacterized protein YgbK (DUF1537 family)
LLTEFGKKLSSNKISPSFFSGVNGKALIVAGSCSPITKSQINYYISQGKKAFMITANNCKSEKGLIENVWGKINSNIEDSILVYTPGSVGLNENNDKKESVFLENVIAGISKRALENTYSRIIVAGGETSGAVMKELKYNAFYIGRSIAPGVPIMRPLHASDLRIVLKSGNFGQKDFFIRALEATGDKNER